MKSSARNCPSRVWNHHASISGIAIFRISLGWITMPTLSQRVAPFFVMPNPAARWRSARPRRRCTPAPRATSASAAGSARTRNSSPAASSMLRPWSTKRVPWSKPAEYIVTSPAPPSSSMATVSGPSKPRNIGFMRCHSEACRSVAIIVSLRQPRACRRAPSAEPRMPPARFAWPLPTHRALQAQRSSPPVRRSGLDGQPLRSARCPAAASSMPRAACRSARPTCLAASAPCLPRSDNGRAARSRTRGARSARRPRRRSRRSRRSPPARPSAPRPARTRCTASGRAGARPAWTRCTSRSALMPTACAVPVLPPVLYGAPANERADVPSCVTPCSARRDQLDVLGLERQRRQRVAGHAPALVRDRRPRSRAPGAA